MPEVKCECGAKAVWQLWGLQADVAPQFLCERHVMDALKAMGRGLPFVMRGVVV